MHKVTSSWVPHFLSTENRKERVDACRENLAIFSSGKWWVYDIVTGDECLIYLRQICRKASNASWVTEGELPRTIVRRGRYEPKFMLCIFFKSSDPMHCIYLDKGETITSSYYINHCLMPIVREINKQRSTSGTKNMKFHHDNARLHVAKSVNSYLEQQGLAVIRHPPYSPDLALCDFWLFDLIKRNLSDATDVKDLNRQITAILQNIPKEEYLKTFYKWLERMQLCIDNQGDYFEHLNNK